MPVFAGLQVVCLAKECWQRLNAMFVCGCNPQPTTAHLWSVLSCLAQAALTHNAQTCLALHGSVSFMVWPTRLRMAQLKEVGSCRHQDARGSASPVSCCPD